jgi:hypothetical protein
MTILGLQEPLISLAVISEQLMAVTPGLVIQVITTGMLPLGLAVYITGGMALMTMSTIMIAVTVVQIRLRVNWDDRAMTLTTRMILHPRMALIGHHARVGMKRPTHTHPLGQRIGIDEDVDPTGVIGLNPMTIDVTLGDVPITVAMIAPPTRPAHRVTEVGEGRGAEVEMITDPLDAIHTPRERVRVQERDLFPLIQLPIMSGATKATLMKTNTRQNYCVGIKVLFMTEWVMNVRLFLILKISGYPHQRNTLARMISRYLIPGWTDYSVGSEFIT